MAKEKISQYDATAAGNTDVDGVNISEACPPSGINNAIRAVMSHLREFQNGSSADDLTIAGTLTSSSTLAVTGNVTLDSASGTSGDILTSAGSGTTPTWQTTMPASKLTGALPAISGAALTGIVTGGGYGVPTGVIVMWSGSIATIPTGWLLCDGTSSTPDLRDAFVIGARSDFSGTAKTYITTSLTQTGGSKDAINVSHTHTPSVTDSGHTHTVPSATSIGSGGTGSSSGGASTKTTSSSTTGVTVALSTDGSSGTDANLPPYFALAYIMKS